MRKSLLRTLCAVLGAGLLAVRNTCSIKRTADDMVSGTRKVLDTAATDHDDAVLLKVVALARDIGCNFDSVGKTDSGDLTKSFGFLTEVSLPFLTNWLNVGIP